MSSGVEKATSAIVGRNLLARRTAERLRQQDIRDAMTRAGFRWNTSTVCGIERGDRRVTVDELVALADVYGVTPGTLLRPPVGT